MYTSISGMSTKCNLKGLGSSELSIIAVCSSLEHVLDNSFLRWCLSLDLNHVKCFCCSLQDQLPFHPFCACSVTVLRRTEMEGHGPALAASGSPAALCGDSICFRSFAFLTTTQRPGLQPYVTLVRTRRLALAGNVSCKQ